MEWLIVLLGVYALGGAAIYTPGIANQMMFHPPEARFERDENFQTLPTKLGDDVTVYFRKHPEAEFTLLYAHGNAEDIDYVKWLVDDLYELKLSILVYEYPGYGYSSGSPSEEGAYAAAEAAHDFLVNQENIPAKRIIAYGRSIGGGVATELAVRRPVGGLILESTFTSAPRVITRLPLYPFAPFNNLKKISSVNTPLLIIHGTDDKLIGQWHSEKLLAEASEPKMHLWIENGNHNDLYETNHRLYKQTFQKFIESLPK